MMKMIYRRIALAAIAALAFSACDEGDPFANTSPRVTSGESQVWELGLPAFPSAWDFALAQRIFVGTDEIGNATGDFVLDSRTSGALAFRAYSTLLELGVSGVRTGIQDLGAIPYESVEEVPDGGYSDVNDPEGVEVEAGHVYAFRMTRQQGGIAPINYAKLGVTQVGSEFPTQPGSRFVRFSWAYQVQPLNHRVVE